MMAETGAEPKITYVTGDTVRLPVRDKNAHKGDFGRNLIIAGCVGYTGAACLASHAAVRCGAGLVTLCVPDAVYPIIAVKCGEVMPVPVCSAEDGTFGKDALAEILPRLERADICLIGPGLNRSKTAEELVYGVIRASRVPLVIDADGINAVSGNIDILDEAKAPVILTPHEGEFIRLGGRPEEGRAASAAEFARSHGCILVLKGHETATAFPDGEVYINTTGNPGMAKGGSGDVLAGMITALIGQHIPLKEAVTAAVWLHGRAGDICAEKYGEYFMTPSDITEHLYIALKSVTG